MKKNIELFEFDNKIISNNDLYEFFFSILKNLSYIEIDITKIGKLKCLNKNLFLKSISEVFFNLSLNDKTLAFPNFTFSWGSNKIEKKFDIQKTNSNMNIFYDYFRENFNINRNIDPMFSCICVGTKSAELLNTKNTSFGNHSFFYNLHKKNADLITFGLEQYDPTFVHYIEEYFDQNICKLKYRKKYELTGFLKKNTKNIKATHSSFLRNISEYPNIKFSDKLLLKDLKKNSLIKFYNIGNAKVYISNCNSVFETALTGLKKNNFYLTNMA